MAPLKLGWCTVLGQLRPVAAVCPTSGWCDATTSLAGAVPSLGLWCCSAFLSWLFHPMLPAEVGWQDVDLNVCLRLSRCMKPPALLRMQFFIRHTLGSLIGKRERVQERVLLGVTLGRDWLTDTQARCCDPDAHRLLQTSKHEGELYGVARVSPNHEATGRGDADSSVTCRSGRPRLVIGSSAQSCNTSTLLLRFELTFAHPDLTTKYAAVELC